MKINILHGFIFEKGEILNLIEEGEYYNKYIFENDKRDRFLLYVNKSFYLEENSIISFDGELELPAKQRNKGDFDYSKYMYSQNIYASIFVKNINSIEVLEDAQFNLVNFIQNSIFESLGKLLPKEQLGILLGMIIGDTFYINEDIEEAFKESGITHLLAVSGSNVTYIILVTKFLFNKIFGKHASNFITIFMVILFVLISGASPSVVRAGVMAIILILSEILARSPNTISTVATTAVLILLYNPLIICDVGFILSFGGTLGIIFLNQKITNWFNKKFFVISENKFFKYILDMLTVTLSAQIVLLPVMWYYFNNVSFISILTNLLVGPFTGIITVLGLITYFISLIYFPLAQLFSYSVYILISLVIKISKICAAIPYGTLLVPTPTILMIVIYYLFIYLIFNNNKTKDNKKEFLLNKNREPDKNEVNIKKFKFIGNSDFIEYEDLIDDNTQKETKEKNELQILLNKFITIIVSVLIIIQIILIIWPQNYIEINMIDVGQGDSMLIKTNNYNILIDGGGSENSNYDVGEQILVPYLLDNTNGTIDLMFISHFHEDHAEGCISVLENLKVRKIIIGTQPKVTSIYENVLRIAKEKNIPIIMLVQGETIKVENIEFEILFPSEELEMQEDLNNNSLVIRMDYYDVSMLLTGDIESETEKILLEDYKNSEKIVKNNRNKKEILENVLDIDILKVAHHGSKTSSIQEFLESATPKIALISLGIDNKFGHPNADVIKRLEELGAQIYRTDEYGEIRLRISNKGVVKIFS